MHNLCKLNINRSKMFQQKQQKNNENLELGPGSLTPLAPISMQEMKLSSGNLLDHPSFQGKRLPSTQIQTHLEIIGIRIPIESRFSRIFLSRYACNTFYLQI